MGHEMPAEYDDRPELAPGLDLFLAAFNELSTCRRFPEGQIPWDSIELYCATNGIVGQQKADLRYHVRHLDGVYRDWLKEQRPEG